MNYTVDAENIFELNNTFYIVTRCFEGVTFDKIVDESLNTLFKRIYALCKTIKKYHDIDILHLDIKPENIMIFPESTEYIMLFDFDSLISKSQLASDESIVFSFSNGYSAPELSYGNKNNISEKTDIYSIGAIVYYKLFGKYADSFARKIGAGYDFENMLYSDKRFQPSFFKTLEIFFQKTLSAYLPHRYNSVDEILPVLSELIRLSDLNSTFVYDNFVYNSACFVGRNDELNKIEYLIKNNQTVFLSGIGGIGKTETAKMFVHQNRLEFNTVVFLSYRESIVNTLCGSDIKINNFEIIKDESDEDLFKRKLDLLKTLLTKNDLIILDNFDTESDEKIEDLFALPCKFIVTTRVNFKDYGYNQIFIDKIRDIYDLTELFFYYNDTEYSDNAAEDIINIIEYIDRHTMTVELISKYLRDSSDTPEILLQKLKNIEGITETDDTAVRQRKDRKLTAKSVNAHLMALFNITAFSTSECELIRSLSLIGRIRISENLFLELCNFDGNKSALSKLIRMGWIECEPNKNKISLHQIILDLVYNELKPTTENCSHIAESAINFDLDKYTYTKHIAYKKMFSTLTGRINGNDLTYAKLLAVYCSNDINALDTAEDIISELTSEYAVRLKIDICFKKIKQAQNIPDDIYMKLDSEQIEEYCTDKIIDLLHKILLHYNKLNTNDNEKLNFYINTAYKILHLVDYEDIYIHEEPVTNMAVYLISLAEQIIESSNLTLNQAVDAMVKIKNFYDEDASEPFHCNTDFICDIEKVSFYQDKINSLTKNFKSSDSDPLPFSSVTDNSITSYYDIAVEYEDTGNYIKAIKYFEKAIADDDFPDNAYIHLADIYYSELDNNDMAIECLLKAIEYSELYGYSFIAEPCLNLIDIFYNISDTSNAVRYCEKLIDSSLTKITEDLSPNLNYQYITAAYTKMYLHESDDKKKKLLWDKCLHYYDKVSDESEITFFLIDFIYEYSKTLKDKLDKMKLFYEVSKRLYHDDLGIELTFELHKRMEKLWEENNAESTKLYIKSIILLGDIYAKMAGDENRKIAIEHYKKAESILQNYKLSDEYLSHLISKQLGECYSDLIIGYDAAAEFNEKNKCNYYLIASVESSQTQNIERKKYIWKNAAENYKDLEKFELAEKCYHELFKPLENQFDKMESTEFIAYTENYSKRLECLAELDDTENFYRHFCHLYRNIIRYYCDLYIENNDYVIPNSLNGDMKNEIIILSFVLEKFHFYKEYIYITILAALIQINGFEDKQFLLSVTDFSDEVKSEIIRRFINAIHEIDTPEMIEDIFDINNMISEYLPDYNEFSAIVSELKWFSDTYQYDDFEYKD